MKLQKIMFMGLALVVGMVAQQVMAAPLPQVKTFNPGSASGEVAKLNKLAAERVAAQKAAAEAAAKKAAAAKEAAAKKATAAKESAAKKSASKQQGKVIKAPTTHQSNLKSGVVVKTGPQLETLAPKTTPKKNVSEGIQAKQKALQEAFAWTPAKTAAPVSKKLKIDPKFEQQLSKALAKGPGGLTSIKSGRSGASVNPNAAIKKVSGITGGHDFSGYGNFVKNGPKTWSKGKIALAGAAVVIGIAAVVTIAVLASKDTSDAGDELKADPTIELTPEDEDDLVVAQDDLNGQLDAMQEAMQYYQDSTDEDAQAALAVLKLVTESALKSAYNNSNVVSRVRLNVCKKRCKGSSAKKKPCVKACTKKRNASMQNAKKIYEDGLAGLTKLGA